jgi:hypothetical protein
VEVTHENRTLGDTAKLSNRVALIAQVMESVLAKGKGSDLISEWKRSCGAEAHQTRGRRHKSMGKPKTCEHDVGTDCCPAVLIPGSKELPDSASEFKKGSRIGRMRLQQGQGR